MFVVIKCKKCGNYMLAKVGQKTRTCPNCGQRNNLRELKVFGRTKSSREAVQLIQHLKERIF